MAHGGVREISFADPAYEMATKEFVGLWTLIAAKDEQEGPATGVAALVMTLSMLIEREMRGATPRALRERCEQVTQVLKAQTKWLREEHERDGQPVMDRLQWEIFDTAPTRQ